MEEVLQRLNAQVGQELGTSDWMEITQERVDAFADATGDHQYIHIDPERAAQSPFGGTVAHGFLTLALVVPLAAQVETDVGEPIMGVNYGLDRVRFPAPVPVGSRIRARVVLDSVEAVPGGIHMKRIVTIEVEDQDKPAMVAETLTRFYY